MYGRTNEKQEGFKVANITLFVLFSQSAVFRAYTKATQRDTIRERGRDTEREQKGLESTAEL